MKIILVDAWNTFVTEKGVDKKLWDLLETVPSQKIIVTNATEEEKQKLGITGMPYPVFSLAHQPDKTNPEYFRTLLKHFHVAPSDVVYVEHNPDAVLSAQSVGIVTHHFDTADRSIAAARTFLLSNTR